MLVICLLNNIVLRGRGFCTSSIAQITGNVPRLLADIVVVLVACNCGQSLYCDIAVWPECMKQYRWPIVFANTETIEFSLRASA